MDDTTWSTEPERPTRLDMIDSALMGFMGGMLFGLILIGISFGIVLIIKGELP